MQDIDCLFNYPSLGTVFKQVSNTSETADFFLNNKRRKSFDYQMFNEVCDNPFDFQGKQTLAAYLGYDDATNDSGCTTSMTSTDKRSQYILSPSNSDLEDLVIENKMDKLLKDLEFID